MNEEGRRKLKQTCVQYESRVQNMKLGYDIHDWVQSIHVGTAKGGRVWTKASEGATWMDLGGENM
eukprot:5388563-Karenia_brevis.AAC.1